MIALRINNHHLIQIFEPSINISGWSEQQINQYSIDHLMLPTSVSLTAETYSRNADRTADYELEFLSLVNRKARPEFTWDLLRAEYVERLMTFLNFNYNFKVSGVVRPREADRFSITYRDFTGIRTIIAYFGQTVEGELKEFSEGQFWENFRIAFPEF